MDDVAMIDGARTSFRVAYHGAPASALLARPDTLAVFGFGAADAATGDPRHVRIPLPVLSRDAAHECWSVPGEVTHGSAGGLRWSAGGGRRFVAVEAEETPSEGIEAVSERAYRLLLDHVGGCPERHLLRIWNYLGAINEGDGDRERYRLFCNGRARGLAAHGVTTYPAATAIGHHGPRGLLQVYARCASEPGSALENPRQVSAWRYPREYGPTAPSFARAMALPGGGLAISGTAAVIGHASHHHDDVAAQADEAFANLETLLQKAGMRAFDASSPLKVYIRHPEEAPAVDAVLARHLDPSVPRLLLQGDICRRELLVEIDGWRQGRH
jgi:chorismate lyase/3-hydroxybenzoate synthase